MNYEIDNMRVLDILKEKAVADNVLSLHLQAATWQAIAERMRDKVGQPQVELDAPQPEHEVI